MYELAILKELGDRVIYFLDVHQIIDVITGSLHQFIDYISTEIILYVYSHCGGSHFGNDYGVVSDVNQIRNTNNLLQITERNKDFLFKIEEKNIEFHQINIMKHNLNLSQKMYKTIDTLPELYIVLGKDNLKNKFNIL